MKPQFTEEQIKQIDSIIHNVIWDIKEHNIISPEEDAKLINFHQLIMQQVKYLVFKESIDDDAKLLKSIAGFKSILNDSKSIKCPVCGKDNELKMTKEEAIKMMIVINHNEGEYDAFALEQLKREGYIIPAKVELLPLKKGDIVIIKSSRKEGSVNMFYHKIQKYSISLLDGTGIAHCDREELELKESTSSDKYDPNFGDDKECTCGHPYYRHFDSYENMAPVGCKYCHCFKFTELKDDSGVISGEFIEAMNAMKGSPVPSKERFEETPNILRIYKFKVKEYSTVLFGQRVEPVYFGNDALKDEGYFFIQRGDGAIFKYKDYRIEWSELIYTEKDKPVTSKERFIIPQPHWYRINGKWYSCFTSIEGKRYVDGVLQTDEYTEIPAPERTDESYVFLKNLNEKVKNMSDEEFEELCKMVGLPRPVKEEPLIVHNTLRYKGKNYLKQPRKDWCDDCDIVELLPKNKGLLCADYFKCSKFKFIWKLFDDITIDDNLACMRKDIGDIYVVVYTIGLGDRICKLIYVNEEGVLTDPYIKGTSRLATAEELQEYFKEK